MQFDLAGTLRALAGVLVFPLMLLTSCLATASTGCKIHTEGGDEYWVGFRADNVLIAGHKVDGDKQGKSADSELSSQPLNEWMEKPAKEEEPIELPTPGSP